jgi:SET domain-containing protein
VKLKIPTKVEVKSSPIHGLGVFAIEPIKKGEIIEECPLITVTFIEATTSNILHRYRFMYPTNNPEMHVIPLGYGCIYNHSEKNNATWCMGRYKMFNFIALRDIEVGEEICTSYGGRNYWDLQKREIEKSESIFKQQL